MSKREIDRESFNIFIRKNNFSYCLCFCIVSFVNFDHHITRIEFLFQEREREK